MRSMRKVVAAVLGAVVLSTLLALAHPTAATAADSGAEGDFVARINAIRSSKGLGPLQVHGELRSVARSWTDQMVGNGGISHNPNLAGSVSANWSKLGENVGVGGSVGSLMDAFVASPAHYKNIVDPAYNYIGVGVSYDANGRMYTTHDFMSLDEGGSSEPDPEPAPAPAPKKKAPAEAAPAPEPEAAPVEPPPPPPPPAAPVRVKTMLTALRAVGS